MPARQPELVLDTQEREVWRAGQFAYAADGQDVEVTKDTGGMPEVVNLYHYASQEQARDAAWRMATRQARA
jgi:hypothetical protein